MQARFELFSFCLGLDNTVQNDGKQMGLRTKIPAQIQIEEAELLGGMDQTTGPAGQPQNLKLWVHMQLLKCKLCNTGVYLCLLDRKFFCLYTRSDISALSVSLPIFSVFSLLLLLSQIA